MYDELLTKIYQRLDCNPHKLAEYLGSDWRVEDDLVTDGQIGGVYRIQGDEIYLIWTSSWKNDWKECK